MRESTQGRDPDVGSLVIATGQAIKDGWPNTIGIVLEMDPIDCKVLFAGWGDSWIFADYLEVISE